MADLQTVKNSLMGLTYEEKIQMSEWLHTQIDFERGEYVKQKGKEVSEKISNFADKAARITKTGASSLRDAFNQATDYNA
jgi:hypothetical protein